jgi:hypothetical protein
MADKNQKGQQQHAEGQHGEKAHAAFLEQIHNSQGGEAEKRAEDQVAERGSAYGANESDGRHRISENREQHDEAEKNSELRKAHGHDHHD